MVKDSKVTELNCREMKNLKRKIKKLQIELSDKYANEKEPYEKILRRSEELDELIAAYQRRLK